MGNLDKVFEKIRTQLAAEPAAPGLSFSYSVWMARALTPADFDALSRAEEELGAVECNRRMVAAMVQSGKYVSTDDEHVEVATQKIV